MVRGLSVARTSSAVRVLRAHSDGGPFTRVTGTRRSGTAALAAEWDGRSGGGWTLAGSRGGRRHPLGLAWRADSPLGATRHANFCTIGQPDGLQVGSRMPFCVLRNDISKNEVYVNRLARRPVVAQSNSTWLTFTGRCCRRGGKTCPICTSYRALINCRQHIRDEPVVI